MQKNIVNLKMPVNCYDTLKNLNYLNLFGPVFVNKKFFKGS